MSQVATNDPITIVFATDNNYCQHLAVTILSLIEKNQGEALNLIVVSIDISRLNKDHLSQMIEERPQVSLRFVELTSSTYKHFPIDGHLSWATYTRIFIPQIVSPEIKKVLYLDCDLLIVDSIRPLWQTDVTDFALAGVAELPSEHKRLLGIPDSKDYVNAGVLLMNLDAWRSQNLTHKLIEYIGNNTRLLKNHDQDALNAVLFNQIFYLDQRWNVIHSYSHNIFNVKANQVRVPSGKQQSLKDMPGIVHFTTDYKPWHYFNPNPFKHHYWRLLKMTPYRNYRPPLRSAFKFLPVKYRPQEILARIFPKQ